MQPKLKASLLKEVDFTVSLHVCYYPLLLSLIWDISICTTVSTFVYSEYVLFCQQISSEGGPALNGNAGLCHDFFV